MVAVHHTICAKADLEKKWLLDPAEVKPRKRNAKSAITGDAVKAAQIFQAEKSHDFSLTGTLVLTTNEEPTEDLVRKVSRLASESGLAIDIWSRSLLAHFLDYTPQGQWIRRIELGIEQERLSAELLLELSRKSLQLNSPLGTNDWVERELDQIIADLNAREIVFVVASSGLGKSVACYKRLLAHVNAGGAGIILPHDILATAISLDQAIELTLRQLHASLASGAGSEALALCTDARPFVIVVEDVNKSAQPATLLEKLSSWRSAGDNKDNGKRRSVHVLCPAWPQTFNLVGEVAKKQLDALCVVAAPYSSKEGAEAVRARHVTAGLNITSLDASAVSTALGDDPLLIALHEPSEKPEAGAVLSQFVENALRRAFEARGNFSPSEYRAALRSLAIEMLVQRNLSPSWQDAETWLSHRSGALSLIRDLAYDGKVIQLAGISTNQQLRFRHDRVRDNILVEALIDQIRND